MDQASYNTLLVLYITIMVLGGVGNMAIIIACFKNKVGYGKPLQKSVWLFLKWTLGHKTHLLLLVFV